MLLQCDCRLLQSLFFQKYKKSIRTNCAYFILCLPPEFQKELIEYIEAGNYVATACKAVGISKVTFYNWIKKGEKGIEPYTKYTKT